MTSGRCGWMERESPSRSFRQLPTNSVGNSLLTDIGSRINRMSRAAPEIYVQPFPGPGSKWPISINGGSQVRWRRDGKELFYVALDGRLMAVSFRAASNAQVPEVGAPVALFVPLLGGAVQKGDYRHQYMVSADRSQFLVATIKEEANSPIMVILNWKPRR